MNNCDIGDLNATEIGEKSSHKSRGMGEIQFVRG